MTRWQRHRLCPLMMPLRIGTAGIPQCTAPNVPPSPDMIRREASVLPAERIGGGCREPGSSCLLLPIQTATSLFALDLSKEHMNAEKKVLVETRIANCVTQLA